MPRLHTITFVLAQLVPTVATGQAQTDDKPPARIGYEKGFTLMSADDQFELKVVGRVQARWELSREDDADDATDEELLHRFSIARARVTLEGHAFGATDYKMQTDFGKGFVLLRDFYLDHPLGGVRLRVGQWKRPYSRQQITSSGSLQLVDRSITDESSAAGRDIGVAVHNGYEKSPDGVEWALGVFNGTGDKSKISCTTTTEAMTMKTTTSCKNPSNVPADIGPMVVARVGWNLGQVKGYSESDLEGGPLRLAVGASYMGELAEGESDAMQHRAQADVLVKVAGGSVAGAIYLLHHEVGGDKETDLGFHVQGGYFLSPKRCEIAARFAQIPEGEEEMHEVMGGFNWFFHGHSLKWQTDAGVLHTTGDPATTTLVVRTQAQLVF